VLLGHPRALFPIGGAGLELTTEALEAFPAAADPEGAAEAAVQASHFAWHSGDRAANDRYMAIALDLVANRPPSRAKTEALGNQTNYLMLGGAFDESIRVGTQALALSRSSAGKRSALEFTSWSAPLAAVWVTRAKMRRAGRLPTAAGTTRSRSPTSSSLPPTPATPTTPTP
jgi:hypothetical protein